MKAMIPGRSSTPVGKAAAENLTANNTSREGSDSGYGSTGNTTDGSMTDHSQDFADGVALRPRIKLFKRKTPKLKIFDKEIPQVTQHRFHDLIELFGRPLCEYLIKAKVRPNSISIKLRVLGECEAAAKPWIVVLCSKTESKKIRQFFNQQEIESQYKPPNPDPFLPSFEVFVCNQPPRSTGGTEIYGDYDETATMCGRRIKVGEAHQYRFATLGGVIKVEEPSGIVTLYGMTVSHILAQQPLGQDNFDQVSSCDEEFEDEGFYSDEEEYELDDASEGDEEVQDFATTGGKAPVVSQSTQVGHLWPKIGCVFASSHEESSMGHDLDWTLIDFDKPADCRPNLLVLSNGKERAARNYPLKENKKFTEDGSSRSVFLLSGTEGIKDGTLSTSLSFLMMGPAKEFTKTYTLNFPRGSVLNAGDSGSWVVDRSTYEVYGHVVASDTMGDTYVVPLDATLRDMGRTLGAAVSLPIEADIHRWLAQHAKAAAEQVPVPVPAKGKEKKVAFNESNTRVKRDYPKLAGHPMSQASASPASSAIESFAPIVDYCNSCKAEFRGTLEDVRSNLQRHLQTCSRNDRHAAPAIEGSISQEEKGALDEWSKRPAVKYSKDIQQKAQESPSQRQESSKPLDGPRHPQSPVGDALIQRDITYKLRITFEGSKDFKLVEGLSVPLHESESYRTIEAVAEHNARLLFAEKIGRKELRFSYGNCTVVSNNGTKIRRPLRSPQDWKEIRNQILSWALRTDEQLQLCILRRYLACQDQPTEGMTLAKLKSFEIDYLMKQGFEEKDYIPHNVLETIISDQAINWIIKEDPQESVPQENHDAFIQQVRAEGRILLAWCVHAGLNMGCLKKLLDDGCKDSSLPLDTKSQCHPDCRIIFRNSVQKQGGFRAARFVEGEHQTLHPHTVVPLHFCSRANVKNDIDGVVTEAYGNTPQNSSSKDSETRTAAWCGSGAYSNVYCVKMDPNHHTLSKDLDACFALKEFREKPPKIAKNFERELAILKELRKYSHPHIVTHLATWTKDDRYYMLFPYAECNLREYMGRNKFDNIDALWLLDQFNGMAGAVKRIHHLSVVESPISNSTLMTPAAGERRTAYHHDLKPENILFFRDGSPSHGKFCISDWGSGQVNTYRTRSYSTKNHKGTITYEPPESEYDGRTSRPSDLWSLGCVFLELLIWAVSGSKTVESFSSQREGKPHANSGIGSIEDDAFWQKKGKEYVLRDHVNTQLRKLDDALNKENAPPFKEIVGYVRRMLKTKAGERIKAPELCDLLERTIKTKRVKAESLRNESAPVTGSLIPTDHYSPDVIAQGNSPSGRSSGPAYAEQLALSPSDMSPQASRHSRNSSTGELMPSNATRSRQSSNASNHSILSVRERRGSHSSAISPRATKGGE